MCCLCGRLCCGRLCHVYLPVVELVSVLVCSHNVQEEDVLGMGVQPGYSELHLGEHLPEQERNFELAGTADKGSFERAEFGPTSKSAFLQRTIGGLIQSLCKVKTSH